MANYTVLFRVISDLSEDIPFDFVLQPQPAHALLSVFTP